MRTRKQAGTIQLSKRVTAPDVWLCRWRERLPNGKRIRRGEVIGTVDQYETKADALDAWKRRLAERTADACVIRFGSLIDRYVAEELPSRFSTRHSYLSYINNHIRPRWGGVPIGEVKPALVRTWLRGLPLAPRSKGHIRCLLHVLFDFAMLWELVELQRNPMELVRLENSTKREREPRVLTVDEFHRLLEQVDEEPFRTMLLTAMCLGLRCSELLGLKWSDFDWDGLTVLVQRAIVGGRVDCVKTKYSRARMPLDPAIAEVLLNWKIRSPFREAEDWVFASPSQGGKKPYRSWGIQQRRIKPAAKAAGLGERIGWHSLRHTYRSWLDETGAPMKVQQELMRHASIHTTMNVYGAAMTDSKREANSKVVRMVLGA